MDNQKFPTLAVALEHCRDEASSHLPKELVDIIDDDTALASMVDGTIGGILETLAVASAIGNAQAIRKGGNGLDYSKIQLARLKVIEGVLEMLEESKAEDIVDEQVFVADGKVGVVGLLREFTGYIKSNSEETAA